MHGVILFELARFADERVGSSAWKDVLQRAGCEGATFTPLRPEPDERVERVVKELAARSGQPAGDVLRQFGRWLAPHLLATYAPLIPATWGAGEILDNVESVIHRSIRLRDPEATPPSLECVRHADGTRTIRYASERRLCAFAVGLVEGIALSHGHVATVTHASCMHAGDAECALDVTLA